jgi:hypothetical protein
MKLEEWLASLNAEERAQWVALTDEEKAAVRDSFTQHIPPTEKLRALTRQLYQRARFGSARALRRQQFDGAQIHECAANARAWVAAHPGDLLAPGYIYFDFAESLPHVRFTPHVGVRTAAGECIDVTPHNALDDHPFLPHTGPIEVFDAALRNGPMDLVYR